MQSKAHDFLSVIKCKQVRLLLGPIKRSFVYKDVDIVKGLHTAFKNCDEPKWGNPMFLEKLALPFDLQTQCFLFDVELLWSADCRKWVIFT